MIEKNKTYMLAVNHSGSEMGINAVSKHKVLVLDIAGEWAKLTDINEDGQITPTAFEWVNINCENNSFYPHKLTQVPTIV